MVKCCLLSCRCDKQLLCVPQRIALTLRRMAAQGFFGCKHFSKANELLAKEGLPEIDWCIGRV